MTQFISQTPLQDSLIEFSDSSLNKMATDMFLGVGVGQWPRLVQEGRRTVTLGDPYPFPQMWEGEEEAPSPTALAIASGGRVQPRGFPGGRAAGRPVAEWDSVSSSCDAIHGDAHAEGAQSELDVLCTLLKVSPAPPGAPLPALWLGSPSVSGGCSLWGGTVWPKECIRWWGGFWRKDARACFQEPTVFLWACDL